MEIYKEDNCHSKLQNFIKHVSASKKQVLVDSTNTSSVEPHLNN